jgi:hypothetical protein
MSNYLLRHGDKTLTVNNKYESVPLSIKVIPTSTIVIGVTPVTCCRVVVYGKYLSRDLTLTDSKSDCDLFFLVDGSLYLDSAVLSYNSVVYWQYPTRDNFWRQNRLQLHTPTTLYETVLTDGIVTFPISCSLRRSIESSRDICHNSPHKRISDLFTGEYKPLLELFADSNLRELLSRIFPGGYHLTTLSTNTLHDNKRPESAVFWHVDYPYHNLPEPYDVSTPLGVQVIITLDKFTELNGATRYVKGSHQNLIFPRESPLEYNTAIVDSGTVIVYLGSLWHSQGVNITEYPRSAILANFSPLSVASKDTFSSVMYPFTLRDGFVLLE